MGVGDTSDLIRSAFDAEGGHAWNDLLERLRPRLVLWVSSRLGRSLRSKVEPEDVAQDILLTLDRSRAGFELRQPGGFMRWVFRIAENRICDLADHYGALKRQLPDPVSFTQTSPSSLASRREELRRLADAIERLPDDYREVVRLRKLQGLACKDVGELMGRSENAVRVLYCRAIKGLRELLEAGDQDD